MMNTIKQKSKQRNKPYNDLDGVNSLSKAVNQFVEFAWLWLLPPPWFYIVPHSGKGCQGKGETEELKFLHFTSSPAILVTVEWGKWLFVSSIPVLPLVPWIGDIINALKILETLPFLMAFLFSYFNLNHFNKHLPGLGQRRVVAHCIFSIIRFH